MKNDDVERSLFKNLNDRAASMVRFCACLALVACSANGGAHPSKDAADAGANDGSAVAVDPTAAIDVAPIAWGPCPTGSPHDDCARINVPRDYAHPQGPSIALFVARKRATDPAHRIGSLFLNPGGPGAAGTSLLEALEHVADPQLQARFDLVAWDPRGTGESSEINCKASPTFSDIALSYDHSPASADKDKLGGLYREYIKQCTTNVPLLAYVSTSATVYDLELLRRAVGDAKLNFLGYSYGTFIGAYYVARYPDRVRAVVLDSVVSPWLADSVITDQDNSFDAALTAFFAWCEKAPMADCPFATNVASRASAYDQLVSRLRLQGPVPTMIPGLTLNLEKFIVGVVESLYSQHRWPDLAEALEAVRQGDGTSLYAASTEVSPGLDAHNAIGCGDAPPFTEADLRSYVSKVTNVRTTVPYTMYSCVGWPFTGLTPDPPAVPATVPPVLLIGSIGDPATPYKWAKATNLRIPGSRLLTSDGYSHGSYIALQDGCIDTPTTAYLLTGALPPAGTVCHAPTPMATAPSPSKHVHDLRSWLRGLHLARHRR